MLEWAGLIMARAMYALLTPTPFWTPGNPGPLAIYYPTPTAIVDNTGAPVLDTGGQPTFNVPPTIDCATQATIDSRFSREHNYWLSYLNIWCTVYNLLDDNINDAFKVSNNPALVGWNLTRRYANFLTKSQAHTGGPGQWPYSRRIHYSGVCIPHKMHLKYCFVASKIVRRYRFLERIRTLRSNSSTMQCACSYNVGYTAVTLKIGTI